MMEKTGEPRSEWLLKTVKQNPEGLLLLAAGAVLLMRKSSSSARTAAEPPLRSRSYASEVQDTASEYIQQAKDTAKSYAESASRHADEIRRSASEQSEKIFSSAQSATQNTINRVLQDQPLLIAAAGLAAGAAVASVFPATSLERSHLGPIGDDVASAAGRIGDRLQRATMDAGEKLKTRADERGLNTTTLKEVAAEAAQAFSDSFGQQKNPDTDIESGVRGPRPEHLR